MNSPHAPLVALPAWRRLGAWYAWAGRLDALCWRIAGCSVWDLSRAEESEARDAFDRGEKPSTYLRGLL